ncbi:MAG: type I secretion C-terminal target domain-containing protein [Pseudomonadales bacterium]|nr:type I secretion C-terminal target domain-containing protein [Pseudomonadales bacterium]
MTPLTQSQLNSLQNTLTTQGTSAFYTELYGYGDPYGRLGQAVTDNNTWQGQLANKMAEAAAKREGVTDYYYGSTKWEQLNEALAQDYLTAYNDNNGVTPNYQQVQTSHNIRYELYDIPQNGWLPNKLLNDSSSPQTTWGDFQTNDGALDLLDDAMQSAMSSFPDPRDVFLDPVRAADSLAFFTDMVSGMQGMDQTYFDDMANEATAGGYGFLAGVADAVSNAVSSAAIDTVYWLGDLLGLLPPDTNIPLQPFLAPPGQPDSQGSPLVLDLDGDGVELYALGDYGSYFDILSNGQALLTGWVEPDDGLLALDVNGDGVINDITELFGSIDTDGFTELSVYDSNADGVIDSNDTVFLDLLIWTDVNSDGLSQSSELHTLADYDIASISLDARRLAGVEIAGNDITHEASYTLTNGTERDIVDAWFTYDETYALNNTSFDFDVRTAFLPTLKGFGTLKDMHIAASIDNDDTDPDSAFSLLSTLTSTIQTDGLGDILSDWDSYIADVETLLYRWADIEAVSPTGRGNYVDGQHLAFYEAFRGYEFSQYDQPNPLPEAGQYAEAIYDYLLNFHAIQILQQVAGSDVFTGGIYDLYSGGTSGDLSLQQAGVDAVKAAAIAATDTTEVWAQFARFLGYTKGLANISAAEETMLDTAVANSGEPSLSDWQDVVSAMTASLGSLIESSDDWGSFEIYYDNDINGDSGDNNLVDDNAGGKKNNEFRGYAGNDTIDGLDGHDKLWGGDGNDTLIGGAGDDFMLGGAGDDIYVYDSGNDTISEENGGGTDELHIAASTGLTEANLLDMYRYGDELLIRLDNNDLITIDGYSGSTTRIEKIVFDSNNYEIDLTALLEEKFYGTDSFDDLTVSGQNFQTLIAYGYDSNDVIQADGAAAKLYGGDGYDTLIGDYLNDFLYGGNGEDVLSGGAGDDDLYGEAGDDWLYAGAGYDRFWGGDGTDVIVFGKGHDHNSVYTTSQEWDIIEFTSDVLPSELSLDIGSNHNDLTITIDTTGDSIFIDNQFYLSGTSGWNYGILEFRFDDGTTWDAAYVRDKYISDHITSGNDVTHGFDNANAFASTAGDDVLYGYYGSDQFYWGSGAGNDVIYTQYRSGDNNTLTFEGLNLADISIDRSVDLDDLIVTNDTTGETLTVRNQFSSAIYQLQTLEFADTTQWSASDLREFYIDQNTTSGADITRGFENSDVFYSSAGDDIIYGYQGSDLYYWGAGAGNDLIVNQYRYGNVDTVNFEGLNTSDLVFAASASGGDNMLIYNTSSGETLTLYRQLYGSYYDLEQFIFDDGTTLNASGLATLATGNLIGSASSETINGTATDNHLVGLDGDDIFVASAGIDVIDGGSGSDTLDYSAWGQAVSMNFYTNSLDKDGDTVTDDTLYSIDNFIGTDYDDVITGGDTDNIIYGGAGNDSIFARGGNDTLYGEDGNDTIHGVGGDDLLYGGSGVDELRGNDGEDILEGGDGNDSLQGGDGNDILNGQDGVDYLYGDDGADYFAFDTATAFGGDYDYLQDFDRSEGDRLDLTDLLSSYDETTEMISSYLMVTEGGSDSYVWVDTEGTGVFTMADRIVKLTGITDISSGGSGSIASESDLDAFYSNGIYMAA